MMPDEFKVMQALAGVCGETHKGEVALQGEMKTPAPSPFASEEEEATFKAARKQFVEEGRLDAWKDLLTSGKSLSPRIGVEIARMLREGQLMLQNQLGEATKRSGVTYALVVKTFKDSRGRPPVLDKQARLEQGAQEVWNRVKPDGQLLTAALKQVCQQFGLSPNELRQAVRKLEERHGKKLPRWPTKRQKAKKPVQPH